ncbi:MAG: hypothetical protein J7515_07480 [Caulobacter sp.]|nr:hypothetical protein [Caulobacter sp.]
MEPSDLLPHRTALIGAAVALAVGLVGGLSLKVGNQDGPHMDTAYAGEIVSPEAQPIAWPSGKIPDYVLGTDFTRAQQAQPPVVVASYNVPEYVPATWYEPTPEPQPQAKPVSLTWSSERAWPSTGGDILDTRLPEDPPSPPEPPETPLAINAPDAVPAAAGPLTMAAAN